jgi:quinol-cytochrome oxidoreductase complex cytochrome b subunit
MKKHIIFAISFILLFSSFQVLSGIILTLTYTPDIAEAWNMSGNLPQEIVIKGSHNPFLLTLFLAFISATIAYFTLRETTKCKRTN